MRGRLIAVEGLTGVGKTTVAPLLATSIGAAEHGTIPAEFAALRRHVDATGSVDARYSFYLSAVLASAEPIQCLLESGRDVVVESFLYRTIAFHQGMGSSLRVSLGNGLILPDCAFLLLCSDAERQRRRERRGQADNPWDGRSETCAERIIDEYRRFEMHEIDTTSLPPDTVVQNIRAIIEQES